MQLILEFPVRLFSFEPLRNISDKNHSTLLTIVNHGNCQSFNIDTGPVHAQANFLHQWNGLLYLIQKTNPLPGSGTKIGMNSFEDRGTDEFFLRIGSKQPCSSLIQIGKTSFNLDKDPIRSILHQQAKTCLTGP